MPSAFTGCSAALRVEWPPHASAAERAAAVRNGLHSKPSGAHALPTSGSRPAAAADGEASGQPAWRISPATGSRYAGTESLCNRSSHDQPEATHGLTSSTIAALANRQRQPSILERVNFMQIAVALKYSHHRRICYVQTESTISEECSYGIEP